MRIEALTNAHIVNTFDCGTPSLNNYLQLTAKKAAKKGHGKTFVLVEEENPTVLGYYTLASGSIDSEIIPTAKSPFPIPTTLIACWAVDLKYKGQKLGKKLLRDAFHKIYESSKTIASHAIVLDALSEDAKAIYQKYGFQELKDGEFHLYLPMSQVAKLLEDPPSRS